MTVIPKKYWIPNFFILVMCKKPGGVYVKFLAS